MRIGIDATALPERPVGAGNYIIQLIRSLAALMEDDELVVFAQRGRQGLIDQPGLKGAQWILASDKSPALRLIWEQTVLPVLVRRARLDLLHSPHYTRPWSLPCTSVVTFHDMTFFLYPEMHTRPKRLFFPLAIRSSARRADALIADSESTRRDAMRLLSIPPGKICTIPLGIGAEFHPVTDAALLAACRDKYGLPQDFILFVGTVEPRKNLPMLLRAYARLLRSGPAASLVIVGRYGWMYEQVFRQIEELGLKDHITFTGYVPAEDLPVVYNLARLFVYPSLYEGWGFPPLEAMACGTPVITTSVSSMQENVGDAGLLVPPQDEGALHEALRRLLADAHLREDLSYKGRQRAAEFTWTRTARETLNLYRQIGVPR
jgi:glycosyltransferase involved in cell wall biosynthesis